MTEKVIKATSHADALKLVALMDIDKDGFISKEDLQTCLKNVNSQQFYNQKPKFYTSQQEVTDKKIVEVCTQIRDLAAKKGYNMEHLFGVLDKDGDAMLTLGEFTDGINLLLGINPIVLSKIYGFMD